MNMATDEHTGSKSEMKKDPVTEVSISTESVLYFNLTRMGYTIYASRVFLGELAIFMPGLMLLMGCINYKQRKYRV